MEYCTTRNKVPFCICPGKNGSDYKVYSEDQGTYECCNQLSFPIFNKEIETADDYLESLANELKGITGEQPCGAYYKRVAAEGIPQELYNTVEVQRKINNVVYKGGTPEQSGNTISCKAGYTPYMVEFFDKINATSSFRSVCHQGSIFDIDDVSFKVYYFVDKNGDKCLNNSCELKWESSHGLNIGEVKHDYQKKRIYEQWWLWVLIAFMMFAIGMGIYFIWAIRNERKEQKLERLARRMHKKTCGKTAHPDKVMALVKAL